MPLDEQEDEATVLARVVERLSTELADKTLECERYRRALDRIAHDRYVVSMRDVALRALRDPRVRTPA